MEALPVLYQRPEFPLAASSEPKQVVDPPVNPPYSVKPSQLRIGTRVRRVVGDCFIEQGTEGVVVNVSPTYLGRGKPQTARVLWDNECVSNESVDLFEEIPKDEPGQ